MSDAETEVSHRGILHLQWEPEQQSHLLHHGLTKEVAAVPGTLSAGSVCMEFSGEYAYLCVNGSTVCAFGLLSTSAHKTLDGRIFLEGLGAGGPVWLDMLLADQSSWKTLYPEWGCQGLGTTSAAFKCSQAPAEWYGCSLFWEVCMLPILLKRGGYASKAKFFSDSWQRFKDICNIWFGLRHGHVPAVRNRGYFFEAATKPADGFKLDFVERSASTMGLIALLSLWSAGQSRGTILDNMQEAGLLLGSMVTEWVVDGKLPLICHSDVAMGPHHEWPMPPAGAIAVELGINGGCLSKSGRCQCMWAHGLPAWEGKRSRTDQLDLSAQGGCQVREGRAQVASFANRMLAVLGYRAHGPPELRQPEGHESCGIRPSRVGRQSSTALASVSLRVAWASWRPLLLRLLALALGSRPGPERLC